MVDKTVKTIEERLSDLNDKTTVKPAKVKKEKVKKTKTKKNKKGLVVAIVAVALAAITAVTGFFHIRKFRNKDQGEPTKQVTVTDDRSKDLSGLGKELDFSKEDENTLNYGKVGSGTRNPEDFVVVTDEKTGKIKIYENEEARNRAKEVGTKIDDKGGTLVVDNTGNVKEKTPSYEIIDPKTGETTKGEGIPSGYVEIAPGEYYKEEDLKDMVKIDRVIYNSNGVLYEVGQYVTKDGYNNLLSLLQQGKVSYSPMTNESVTQSTFKISEEPVEEVRKSITVEETFTPDEGVINTDGTYTINGFTFQTKEDYNQWVIQGYEGYGIQNGIMVPITEEDVLTEEEYQKIKR